VKPLFYIHSQRINGVNRQTLLPFIDLSQKLHHFQFQVNKRLSRFPQQTGIDDSENPGYGKNRAGPEGMEKVQETWHGIEQGQSKRSRLLHHLSTSTH
jgi:hypothetical protein